MNAPILSARGLHLSYGPTHALRGVDIDIAAGEVLAVMGPSGSGKSSLLHVLAGVLLPDTGSVIFGGRDLTKCSEDERSRLRLQEFGFIFQFGQLLPDLSAVDNVALPLLLTGVKRRRATQIARERLNSLGLQAEADKLPTAMSGGQAQRVAVARALVLNPKIIFADEPTGSLDSLSAEQTMEVLISTARQVGATVVIITHDPRTAAYADREVIVRDGLITAGSLLGPSHSQEFAGSFPTPLAVDDAPTRAPYLRTAATPGELGRSDAATAAATTTAGPSSAQAGRGGTAAATVAGAAGGASSTQGVAGLGALGGQAAQ